jgi:hypothetical protein
MCGVVAASADVIALYSETLPWTAVEADQAATDRVTAALWHVAGQADLVAFWQHDGARCREYYELGSTSLQGAVLKAACTMFADRTVVDRRVTEYLTVLFHHIEGAAKAKEAFDKLLLKWRFLDATHMQAGILREGVRDAFEAIWTAREYGAAYTYIDTICLNIELLKEMA